MSFFIRKLNKKIVSNGNKRKFSKDTKFKKIKKQEENEEIESDDEIINGKDESKADYINEYDIEETAQEKKIKAAKLYLNDLRDIEKLRENDDELNENTINTKLKEDVLKKLGTLYIKKADSIIGFDEKSFKFLKNGHKLSITSIVVSSDNQFIYSVSKDSSIIKWDLKSFKRLKTIPGIKKKKDEKEVGHTSTINSITVSTDNKFLATGCNSNLINIWNPDNLEFIHCFRGHSAQITGLVIKKFSHVLYSISKDRSLRVWDLDTMCYVQTLFGHQETITSIDMLIKERAVTSGGFDSTLRLWKIAEETQLVFQGEAESLECVKLIDEQRFISGTMNGKISLWSMQKKRPLFTLDKTHGCDKLTNTPNWICSIATLPFGDIFATGSNDGFIRIWKLLPDKFEEKLKIPLNGFINSLQFGEEGNVLIAGIGQEHRLGRWWKIKECKNSIVVIPFTLKN